MLEAEDLDVVSICTWHSTHAWIAVDACEAGFDTHLIADATRAVDVSPGDGERALAAMRAAGAWIETTAR
jgi:nicotinamidase/pyrazinamidase